MIISILLILLFPTVTYSQDDAEFNNWCIGTCHFESGEITRKRLEQWPRDCSDICTRLQINSNCDVSYSELKEAFKNMKKFRGGIVIDGAKFKNLSFFPENMDCKLINNMLVITNNQHLENADRVLDVCKTRYAQVLNNPRLNASTICHSDWFNKNMTQVAGNLGNCACSGGTANSTTIDRFKNCKYISGSLIITDVDDNSNLAALSKIRWVAGDLEITKTNLTTLSFLKSLEQIESRHLDYNYKPKNTSIINIHDNPNLKRIELYSLSILEFVWDLYNAMAKVLRWSRFTMNFQNLSPDFCLTSDEVYLYLRWNIRFENLEARFCEERNRDFAYGMLCVFKNMEELGNDCDFISGDVLVDSGDEEYVKKLENVAYVFGSITFQDTILTNWTVLRNLKIVVNLNKSQPVIQFLRNFHLQNLQFPLVQPFLTNGNNKVIIDDNNPNIFKNLKACMIFQYNSLTNVSINERPCKSIPKTLPNGYGYNLYNMNYGEYSLEDWDYYEDSFYMVNLSDYKNLNVTLRMLNLITAITCLLINTFNLIILLQKKLRENFIYILMIGVSISDVLMVIAFILDYMFDAGWIYQLNLCEEISYYHALINVINECVQVTTRRYSSFLALLMAFLRTFSVTFPMNTFLIRISKPKPIILISLILLGICCFYDGIQYYLSTNIIATDHDENSFHVLSCDNTYIPYINEKETLATYYLHVIIDTTTTVITGFLYLLVTILLLYQLRIAHKRRNALRGDNDRADGTSKLITIMAVTFFISEVLYGAYQSVQVFYVSSKKNLKDFGASSNYLFWTFLIINSNIHCLICFFMSSQYREVVRQLFWRKEKKAVTLINMATISVAKSSSSRGTI